MNSVQIVLKILKVQIEGYENDIVRGHVKVFFSVIGRGDEDEGSGETIKAPIPETLQRQPSRRYFPPSDTS